MLLLAVIASTLLFGGTVGTKGEHKGLYRCYARKTDRTVDTSNKYYIFDDKTDIENKNTEYNVFYLHIDEDNIVTYIKGKKKLPFLTEMMFTGKINARPENEKRCESPIDENYVRFHIGTKPIYATCQIVKSIENDFENDSTEGSDDIKQEKQKENKLTESKNKTTGNKTKDTKNPEKEEGINGVISRLNAQNGYIDDIFFTAYYYTYNNINRIMARESIAPTSLSELTNQFIQRKNQAWLHGKNSLQVVLSLERKYKIPRRVSKSIGMVKNSTNYSVSSAKEKSICMKMMYIEVRVGDFENTVEQILCDSFTLNNRRDNKYCLTSNVVKNKKLSEIFYNEYILEKDKKKQNKLSIKDIFGKYIGYEIINNFFPYNLDKDNFFDAKNRKIPGVDEENESEVEQNKSDSKGEGAKDGDDDEKLEGKEERRILIV